MIGIIVVPVAIAYLALLFLVTRVAYRWAVKRGLQGKKRFLVTAGGFLVVYLPVFWDHIPTLITHTYYCHTQAGFWVYKTLDQWKAENPGVMETLVANKVSIQRVGDDENHTDTQILNQRFRWVTEKHNLVSYLPIYRWRSQVIDANNGEAVARWVDFSIGKGLDYLKIWMNDGSCPDGTTNRNNLFRFADELIKVTNGTRKGDK